MSFEKYGFLGKEAKTIDERILVRNKEAFELFYEINRLAHEIKSKFVIHNLDGQEVLAACLFSRVLEGIQAGVILTKIGLEHDVKVIIRSVLESLFPLKICCENDRFYTEYFKSDEAKRLKIMNVAHKYTGKGLFRDIREEATEQVMSELKDKIKREKIKELKVEELARRAGMQEYYDLHYRHCSSVVHSTPRSLERYVNHDGEKISGLIHEPTDKDAQMHLATLAEFLLKSIANISLLFEINEYENNVSRLIEKVKKSLKGDSQ